MVGFYTECITSKIALSSQLFLRVDKKVTAFVKCMRSMLNGWGSGLLIISCICSAVMNQRLHVLDVLCLQIVIFQVGFFHVVEKPAVLIHHTIPVVCSDAGNSK